MKKVLLTILCAALLAGGALGTALLREPVSADVPLSPAELWSADDGVEITANVNAPDYMLNGYDADYRQPDPVVVTPDTLPEYRKNGIYVHSQAGGAEIVYNNVIDLSRLTGEDELLSIAPIPSARGTASFTQFDITLTDADDESNYLKITILQNRWANDWTATNVEAPGISARGYKWGDIGIASDVSDLGFESNAISFSGTVVSSFEGISNEEMIYKPFTLHYDPEELLVSIDQHTGKNTPVLKLDDGEAVGYGNEWGGFKNNRVKISIAATGFLGGEANYMVFCVGGVPMNGAGVTDTQNPSILVEENWDEPPVAAVGKEYKLYPAEAYDAIDGALDLKISVAAPGEAEFTAIEGESFVPETAGTYTLRYEATDAAGHTETAEYAVLARYAVPPMEISAEPEKTQYVAGETIALPEVSVSGGSGSVNVFVYAERLLTGDRYDVENNTVSLRLPGEYYLRYRAEDYLGNAAYKSILIEIVSDGQPVFEGDLTMYEKFIDKEEYKLPEPAAYDYTSRPGAKLKAAVKITAYGTGEKASYSEEVKNYVFVPDTEKYGSEVRLVYEISCGENVPVVREFTCAIAEAEFLSDYFSYDAEATDVSYNTAEELTESYMLFSAKSGYTGDMAFSYIHPLRASNFSALFHVPYGMQSFGRLEVKLRDADNASVGFTMALEQYTATNTLVYYNGQRYSMNGGYDTAAGVSATPLELAWNGTSVLDYRGNTIFTPTVNDDGTPFTGFTSGRIFVEFRLTEISGEAGVKITHLNNQVLYADYKSEGMSPFSDAVSPEIEYAEDLIERPSLNQRIRLPYARGYDVISPNVQVYVTLTSPTGEKLIDNQISAEGMDFVLDSYGIYSLTYYAEDSAGNYRLDSYSLFAEDTEAPSITVSSEELSGKVGKRVKLPDAVVLDNQDENPVLSIYVVSPDATYIETVNNQFVPQTAGRYLVRYYAYDANNNVTIKEIVCNVK